MNDLGLLLGWTMDVLPTARPLAHWDPTNGHSFSRAHRLLHRSNDANVSESFDGVRLRFLSLENAA